MDKKQEEEIRQKTIDEIIEWIDSETDTNGRIKYSPTCEMVYEHLKEMKKQITI